MGILNLTPDSRLGNAYYQTPEKAAEKAYQMLEEGASIIDIGGESTRPGAEKISVQEELDRILPVLENLKKIPAIISVDTRKTEVMKHAVKTGAQMINDINALQDTGALEFIAQTQVAVCLMHMQGEPETMQENPQYQDVVSEVRSFLNRRLQACLAAGINQQRIVLDPGFGFGKTLQHNLILLNELEKLNTLKMPLLVGLSRKSMLEKLFALSVENRLPGSLALAILAFLKGARIIRTHDIKETYQAIHTAMAVQQVNEHDRATKIFRY